jgi:hypothetical protein
MLEPFSINELGGLITVAAGAVATVLVVSPSKLSCSTNMSESSGMEPFSINELGGLITVVAGAVATVLFALQKSSCTDISCCGLRCKRDPALIAAARDEPVVPPKTPKKPASEAEPEPEPEPVRP